MMDQTEPSVELEMTDSESFHGSHLGRLNDYCPGPMHDYAAMITNSSGLTKANRYVMVRAYEYDATDGPKTCEEEAADI